MRSFRALSVAVVCVCGMVGVTACDGESTRGSGPASEEEVSTVDTTTEPAPAEEPAGDATGEDAGEAGEPEAAAAEDDSTLGQRFQDWYFTGNGISSWEEFPAGWATHIVDFNTNDDTLLFVTNLDKNNPDGKEMAKGLVKTMQNNAEGAHNVVDVPEEFGQLQFVQVFDMQGHVLARGGLNWEF